MQSLYIVVHGDHLGTGTESWVQRAQRHRLDSHDPPLSDQGSIQATEVGKFLLGHSIQKRRKLAFLKGDAMAGKGGGNPNSNETHTPVEEPSPKSNHNNAKKGSRTPASPNNTQSPHSSGTARQNGSGIAHVYSSPYLCALQTADRIALSLGTRIEVEPGLAAVQHRLVDTVPHRIPYFPRIDEDYCPRVGLTLSPLPSSSPSSSGLQSGQSPSLSTSSATTKGSSGKVEAVATPSLTLPPTARWDREGLVAEQFPDDFCRRVIRMARSIVDDGDAVFVSHPGTSLLLAAILLDIDVHDLPPVTPGEVIHLQRRPLEGSSTPSASANPTPAHARALTTGGGGGGGGSDNGIGKGSSSGSRGSSSGNGGSGSNNFVLVSRRTVPGGLRRRGATMEPWDFSKLASVAPPNWRWQSFVRAVEPEAIQVRCGPILY